MRPVKQLRLLWPQGVALAMPVCWPLLCGYVHTQAWRLESRMPQSLGDCTAHGLLHVSCAAACTVVLCLLQQAPVRQRVCCMCVQLLLLSSGVCSRQLASTTRVWVCTEAAPRARHVGEGHLSCALAGGNRAQQGAAVSACGLAG